MKHSAWLIAGTLIGFGGFLSFLSGAHSQDRPWMNKSLSAVRRAELLVQQMTLDEKISQIHMIDKPDHPREVPGIERLGVPVFKITNGPAGAGPGDSRPTQPATAMPSALALAASWDPSLAETFGRVVADEVAAHGEDWPQFRGPTGQGPDQHE